MVEILISYCKVVQVNFNMWHIVVIAFFVWIRIRFGVLVHGAGFRVLVILQNPVKLTY